MCQYAKNRSLFLAKIQRKREEMFFFGGKYGLTAHETLAISRELDQLLNEYQRLFQSDSSAQMTGQSCQLPYVYLTNHFHSEKVKSYV